MVPEAFHDYFLASAGAGAALVGLLFIAVSIAPEQTVTSSAPVERQTVALSAYTALINAFLLSLVALLPQTNLGGAAFVLSVVGLANHFILGWNLLRGVQRKWLGIIRGAALVLAALLLYGYELYNAILLLVFPTNTAPVTVLAPLLIGMYALGLTRAWQLLGGRNYRLSEWLSPLHDIRSRHSTANSEQFLSATGTSNDTSEGDGH